MQFLNIISNQINIFILQSNILAIYVDLIIGAIQIDRVDISLPFLAYSYCLKESSEDMK